MSALIESNNTNYGIALFLKNFTSESTKRAYAKDIEGLFRFLAAIGVVLESPANVELEHLVAYRDSLVLEGKTPNTVNRKLSSIRSLFGWFQTNGHVTRNVVAMLKLPKAHVTAPTQALSDTEVFKILNAPDKTDPKEYTYFVMLNFLIKLGLRRSELVNIKLNHLMMQGDMLTIRILGKGSKVRMLPIPKDLEDTLKVYMKNHQLRGDDYFFQLVPGKVSKKPISTSTVYKMLRRYKKQVGITKAISPHSLRATATTKAIEMGIPITEVADFLGHASITTTQIYWKRRHNLSNSPVHKICKAFSTAS